jgi:hypothetical protein
MLGRKQERERRNGYKMFCRAIHALVSHVNHPCWDRKAHSSFTSCSADEACGRRYVDE